MYKGFVFYISTIIVFLLLIVFVIDKGNQFSVPHGQVTIHPKTTESTINSERIDYSQQKTSSYFKELISNIQKKVSNSISILLLQIIIIVFFARIFGFIFGKLGIPTVIGEILAGITLGPSLLGHALPEISAFVFPASSMPILELLSQIGLVLFMFIIGMELDMRILKLKAKTAIIISHTSILIAFFIGTIMAYLLYAEYAPKNTTFTAFALFIGIAMSIAAFPVLARIVQEKGLTKTPLGKTIITIAAVDDLTAWCILATVIAIIQAGNFGGAIYSIGMAILYIFLMLTLVQPLLRKIGKVYVSREIIDKKIIALIFMLIFVSAYFTEIIGIKALFGGFLAGVIMPQSQQLKKIIADKIEDFSLVVLLPLFFVFTGLRTEIGLLNQSHYFGVCLLIIGFAIVGKFGSSFIASRVMGQSWKNSFLIGALMNTRGLMELIVLNIGYDMGILSPEIFTMMVIMTLVTTFMTGPVISLIEFINKRLANSSLKIARNGNLKILISFGIPQMGATLLSLLSNMIERKSAKHFITAMHLTPHTEITHTDALKYENTSFQPIKNMAKHAGIQLNTIYKTSEDVVKEIINTTRRTKYDLILIGAAKSIFTNTLIGGKVRTIVRKSNCNTAVLIDKDFTNFRNVLVITDDDTIHNFMGLVKLLNLNSTVNISLIQMSSSFNNYPDIFEYINKNNLNILTNVDYSDMSTLNAYDLVIIDFNHFEDQIRSMTPFIDSKVSLLLVNFNDDHFQQIFQNK